MTRRLILHAFVLLVVLGAAATARADSFTAEDTAVAIVQSSGATGIASAWLYRVVDCETGHTLDPNAVGDHGTSLGAAQLHIGGGELPRFYAFGYADPFDPYQSVLFMAEEFARGRAAAWSCR